MEETPEFLLWKSEGVKDAVKHLEREIKKEQKVLRGEEKLQSDFGYFEDCGESYRQAVVERKARIAVLIEQKISLEKYAKLLKHMAEEVYQRKPLVLGELYSYAEVLQWHERAGTKMYGTSYRRTELQDCMFRLEEVDVSAISELNYHKFNVLKQLEKSKKKDEQLKIHLSFIRRLITSYRQGQNIPPLVLERHPNGESFGIIDGSHRTSALDHIGRIKTLAFVRV